MAHKFDPNDPYSVGYGHTIGEAYPQVIENMFNKSSKDSIVVRPGEAQSFVKNQNNNAINGVSDTSENNFKGLGALDGTLGQYIPQAQNIYNSLYSKSKKQQEKEDRMNTGMMMLNFFTKMGAEASRPGATALGAASVAGADTASMYIKQVNADRARRDAEKKGVVGLASQLMTAADAKEIALGKKKTDYVPIYKDGESLNVIKGSPDYIKKITQENWKLTKPAKAPGFTYKAVDAGIPAYYVKDEEEAARLLKPYIDAGLSKDSSSYKNLVQKLIAPADKPGLIGKEYMVNDMFGMIKPIQIGEGIGDLILQGNKDAPAPSFIEFKKEYSKKYGKDFQGTVSTYAEVIPKIQSAMQILIGKNGPDTGKLSEFTLPFKQIINQSLGTVDPNVMNLESLQSIAFYLATKMRPKGSGSTSDMEFRAYMKAALSLNNSAQANYISLYAMKKMKENSEFLNEKSFQLIDSGEVRSISELNSELRKIDTGLFAKFDLKSYDGEIRDNTGKLTPEFLVARQAWEDKLDSGTVAINNGIYDLPNTYVIKDWRKP
mgnify:FL=1